MELEDTLLAEAAPAAATLPRGAAIGRYLVIDVLGRGGMGVVYSAFDPELDRKIAVKVLRWQGDEDARLRTRREAQALAKLKHANVLTVYDVGDFGDGVFIAMELVDGGTLRAWQAKRDWRAIVQAYVGAGRGLAAAHAAGLVHRDFKPDNALVDAADHIRVTDFGLVRLAGERDAAGPIVPPTGSLTVTGQVMGTLGYMPPEQARGDAVDARGDQFSWCVSLWEALYGERPFGGGPYERYVAALEKAPVLPDGAKVPRELGRALQRGLSASPVARWPSMDALLAAIAPRRRTRWWWLAGVGAVLAIAVFAFARRPAAEADTCIAAPQRLAGVWDDARRAQLATLFGTVNRPIVASTLALVRGDLDAYADAWATQWTGACASEDRKRDPLLYQQRLNCLDRALVDFGGITRSMLEVEPGAFSDGWNATLFTWGPSVEACAQVESLRAMPPAPRPELREEVGKLVLEIHRAREVARQAVNVGQGSLRDALAHLESITKRLDQLGDAQAAYAAFLVAWYSQEWLIHDPKAFTAALERAEAFARKYREDRALASVLSLATTAALSQGEIGAAETRVRELQQLAERSGQPIGLDARARLALAKLDWSEVERLVTLEPTRPPWQHWPQIGVPNRQKALWMLGRPEDAVAVVNAALDETTRLWPSGNRFGIETLNQLVRALLVASHPPREILAVLDRIAAGPSIPGTTTALPFVRVAAMIHAGEQVGLDAAIAAVPDGLLACLGFAANLGWADVVNWGRSRLPPSAATDEAVAGLLGTVDDLDEAIAISRKHPHAFDPKSVSQFAIWVGFDDILHGRRNELVTWSRANRPDLALQFEYVAEHWRDVVEIYDHTPSLVGTVVEEYAAIAMLELGDAKRALPLLERAMSRSLDTYQDVELATESFGLARALEATGGDHARAQRLAREAQKRVLPADRATLAPKIAAWLAAHP